MRKSSAIFVSAIALGLAMFVPLKASAQGVNIYIGPLATQATPTIRPIPATMDTAAIRVTDTPIRATVMAMAVLVTAPIGARVDALLAEFIGDGIGGIKPRRQT